MPDVRIDDAGSYRRVPIVLIAWKSGRRQAIDVAVAAGRIAHSRLEYARRVWVVANR